MQFDGGSAASDRPGGGKLLQVGLDEVQRALDRAPAFEFAAEPLPAVDQLRRAAVSQRAEHREHRQRDDQLDQRESMGVGAHRNGRATKAENPASAVVPASPNTCTSTRRNSGFGVEWISSRHR